jgi:Predicted transcriptional regulators
MDYSQNIKRYRKSKGLTQSKLAEILNVKPTSVSAWELGRNKPLMDKIELMAQLFNVSVSDIIGDTFIQESDINQIYNQLDKKRKAEVIDFAKFKLNEQNNKNTIVDLSSKKEETKDYLKVVAAHIDDDATEEELDEIAEYIRSITKKKD